MRCLVDTSVLVRVVDPSSPLHERVRDFLDTLSQDHELLVAPQCLYELWVVVSRPLASNGLGQTSGETDRIPGGILRFARLLPDPGDLVDRWRRVCLQHSVIGKPAHDARLAAFALAHSINAIVTLNEGDFKRFGLTVLVP